MEIGFSPFATRPAQVESADDWLGDPRDSSLPLDGPVGTPAFPVQRRADDLLPPVEESYEETRATLSPDAYSQAMGEAYGLFLEGLVGGPVGIGREVGGEAGAGGNHVSGMAGDGGHVQGLPPDTPVDEPTADAPDESTVHGDDSGDTADDDGEAAADPPSADGGDGLPSGAHAHGDVADTDGVADAMDAPAEDSAAEGRATISDESSVATDDDASGLVPPPVLALDSAADAMDASAEDSASEGPVTIDSDDSATVDNNTDSNGVPDSDGGADAMDAPPDDSLSEGRATISEEPPAATEGGTDILADAGSIDDADAMDAPAEDSAGDGPGSIEEEDSGTDESTDTFDAAGDSDVEDVINALANRALAGEGAPTSKGSPAEDESDAENSDTLDVADTDDDVADAMDAPAEDSVDEGRATIGAVQAKSSGMTGDASDIQGAAAEGVRGGGASLPYLDEIQESFGPHHHVRDVEAYVGGKAADAASAIGAEAYATGNKVALPDAPDLFTVAHEAAHVVQQRAGVQLLGGVGQAGDAYEQNADQVAHAVVRGESVAHLLGTGTASGVGGSSVQRKNAVPPGTGGAPQNARDKRRDKLLRRAGSPVKGERGYTTVDETYSAANGDVIKTLTEYAFVIEKHAELRAGSLEAKSRLVVKRVFTFNLRGLGTVTITSEGQAALLTADRMPPGGDLSVLILAPALTATENATGTWVGHGASINRGAGPHAPGQSLSRIMRHDPLLGYHSSGQARIRELRKILKGKRKEGKTRRSLDNWERITNKWVKRLNRHAAEIRSGLDRDVWKLRSAKIVMRHLLAVKTHSREQKRRKMQLYRRLSKAYRAAKRAKGPNKGILDHGADVLRAGGKAVVGLGEGLVETGRMARDLGTYTIDTIGEKTGLWDIDWKPWSSVGKAYESGKSSLDILEAAYDSAVDRTAKAIEHVANGDYSKALDMLAEIGIDFVVPAGALAKGKKLTGAGKTADKVAASGKTAGKVAPSPNAGKTTKPGKTTEAPGTAAKAQRAAYEAGRRSAAAKLAAKIKQAKATLLAQAKKLKDSAKGGSQKLRDNADALYEAAKEWAAKPFDVAQLATATGPGALLALEFAKPWQIYARKRLDKTRGRTVDALGRGGGGKKKIGSADAKRLLDRLDAYASKSPGVKMALNALVDRAGSVANARAFVDAVGSLSRSPLASRADDLAFVLKRAAETSDPAAFLKKVKAASRSSRWSAPKGWQLPADTGVWLGRRGDSGWIPKNSKDYNLERAQIVDFKKGKIDLRPHAKPYTDARGVSRTELRVPLATKGKKGMTGVHDTDMPVIHEHLARKMGWVHPNGKGIASRARKWLKKNKLTPHHHEGTTVLLVDKRTHDVHHTGSARRIRDKGAAE